MKVMLGSGKAWKDVTVFHVKQWFNETMQGEQVVGRQIYTGCKKSKSNDMTGELGFYLIALIHRRIGNRRIPVGNVV